MLVLFTRVATAPPTSPQTAIWHFGWHVTDTRASLETYQRRPDLELLPLYTTDEGGSVWISSDTWPSTGSTPGLTKAQIALAKAKGVLPTRRSARSSGTRSISMRRCSPDGPAACR